MKEKLCLVAGARPNFMKVAPLISALNADGDFQPVLIHTGQHYDDSMSGSFFRDLNIPPPDHHLEVGPGSHAQQTGEIMKRLEPVFLAETPRGVIVVGDVNSTLAGALVASKLGISVIHAEAGLRSFDRTMPEEINRIVTDSISDLLLVTEESGRDNLLKEGVNESRIAMVGNLMVDSLRSHLADARKTDIHQRLGIEDEEYGLVTLHRPANVDSAEALDEILRALTAISKEVPLYWPVHPRVAAHLASLNLTPRIHLLEPLSYYEFLHMQAKATAILTDSGGIQEESTVLGVPCFTLRKNTERPATVYYGTNTLAGVTAESILETWRTVGTHSKGAAIPPLWDGQAGVRCSRVIKEFFAERYVVALTYG